ncbi:MAG: hypothetical protein QOE49_448, partial [Rhodospirillaceae bacterium]|nr:hypothetical protein [Rhodospirillaceae bacterium]
FPGSAEGSSLSIFTPGSVKVTVAFSFILASKDDAPAGIVVGYAWTIG